MNSLRRWLYRPKRSDSTLLAQFYFADEELNLIAAELDGFEGRKDPERCAALVNQLRACQARVLNIVSQMMDESIKDQRALRDFRVKFPDDVIQENLAGQLWFGAECLAAGSSIMNREVESACMRPLARALTKNLDSLRTILREQCLRNVDDYTDLMKENLIIFDKLFAEFELSYVSAMVSVKTAHEYDMIQEITVLFSETVQRALQLGLLTQEMIDEYDPALMFTIPRLAIISGVLIFKDGPLNPDNEPWNISEMFRPFQTLLLKIRELLGILTPEELNTLERALCSQDEPSFLLSLEEKRKQAREERRKHRKEKKGSGKVKNNQEPSDGDNGSIESELTAKEIAERLEALALNFEASHSQNNGEVSDQTNGSVDPAVSKNDTNSEEVPSSSSSQNGDIAPDNDSTPTQACVSLGDVEDLYHEANLDGSEISATSAYHGHDLLIQGIQMPSQFRSNDENGQTCLDNEDSSSLTNDNGETQDEVLNDRDRFSLNKCDSKDSGLQSEVVSNSGSMFTISSSDSNQQILGSDSLPTPSDQNCTDSSEDVDSSHDLLTDENCSSRTQLENSSDSSATIVSMKTADNVGNEDIKEATERVRCDTHSSENSDVPHFQGLDSDETSHSGDNQMGGAKHSIFNNTTDRGSRVEICEAEVEAGVSEALSNCIDNVCSIQTDSFLVQDSNLDSDNSERTVSSAQSVSIERPNNSTGIVLDENSNHSHDASCDKAKPTVEHVNNDGEDLFRESSNNFHTEVEVTIESRSDENSVDKDNSVVNNSTNSNTQGENVEQKIDSNSNNSAAHLIDQSIDDAISSLPSSSFCVNGDDSSTNLNLTSDISSRTDNISSSTQQSEIPQASGAAPNVESVSNGCDATPVNSVNSTEHKGVSNVKSKTNFKKKSKNLERRGRRQESGSHRRSRESKPMLCPHHAKMILEAHQQLESECYNSSDTSSYTSECGDQEEIALAIEAAENATRNQVRARFRSSSDMIHRLFVCISGVADQLQTNFAGDLRNILRCVFDMNCPEPMDTSENDKPKDSTPLGAAYRAMSHASRTPRHRHSSLRRDPPTWLPDEQSNDCMACQVPFNFLRRRHHCRNCGKIFCGRCSSNFVPLPHFGEEKAVRVCNRCFMFQVTPFTHE